MVRRNPAMTRRVLCTAVLAIAWAGCKKDDEGTAGEPPLGMILANDGQIYAGIAVVDLTPEIGETFTDLNGNHLFDGCLDDPAGSGGICEEPFDDADGDGQFEPVWIGGFDPLRPALDVHDPIEARALVLSYDGAYVALVSLDLIGLASPRIHTARDQLAADGFAKDHLLVASTHNHQGPDTMGLWGDPLAGVSGMSEDYQQRVTDAIEQSVRDAAADMTAVQLDVAALSMRDFDPKWLTGGAFGGKNPTWKMHGMINDIRDPVIVSDQLLVVQGVGDGSTVFTFTNWSGHPEVRGGDNNSLSADHTGVLREVLEARYGGLAIHMPEALGGMQSALGGDLPLVAEDGSRVYQTCDAAAVADTADTECYGLAEGDPRVDADGDAVPEWAERGSWDFVRSHGWILADATVEALDAAQTVTQLPIRVEAETLYVPVENSTYHLLGPMGIFDLNLDDAVLDQALCPEATMGSDLGCLETRAFRVQLGPIGFSSAPGELVPELGWGFPDDPQWTLEADDPTARGPGATYFPQHDPDCNDIDFEDCTETFEIGDCDCLSVHAWPYTLAPEPGAIPILDHWDTEYRAVLGMADNYLSYIVPEDDYNHEVSLLTDDGDHYEDTVTPSGRFATRLLEAHQAIADRW